MYHIWPPHGQAQFSAGQFANDSLPRPSSDPAKALNLRSSFATPSAAASAGMDQKHGRLSACDQLLHLGKSGNQQPCLVGEAEGLRQPLAPSAARPAPAGRPAPRPAASGSWRRPSGARPRQRLRASRRPTRRGRAGAAPSPARSPRRGRQRNGSAPQAAFAHARRRTDAADRCPPRSVAIASRARARPSACASAPRHGRSDLGRRPAQALPPAAALAASAAAAAAACSARILSRSSCVTQPAAMRAAMIMSSTSLRLDLEALEHALVADRLGILFLLALGPADQIVGLGAGEVLHAS